MMFDVVLYDDAYRVDALSVDVVCLKTWIVLVGSLLKIVDMFEQAIRNTYLGFAFGKVTIPSLPIEQIARLKLQASVNRIVTLLACGGLLYFNSVVSRLS